MNSKPNVALCDIMQTDVLWPLGIGVLEKHGKTKGKVEGLWLWKWKYWFLSALVSLGMFNSATAHWIVQFLHAVIWSFGAKRCRGISGSCLRIEDVCVCYISNGRLDFLCFLRQGSNCCGSSQSISWAAASCHTALLDTKIISQKMWGFEPNYASACFMSYILWTKSAFICSPRPHLFDVN